MNKVIWIDEVERISHSQVLFDTNIWIMIEGFNEGAPQKKVDAYSGAYETLLRNENSILYNEYIVNEFCNTCARIEFNSYLLRTGRERKMSFKEYRRTDEFRESMLLIREACMNIVDACVYAPIGNTEGGMRRLVDEICEGRLDLTDIVIRDFCRANDVYLMTDDADYRGSGLKLISSNRRLANAPPPA